MSAVHMYTESDSVVAQYERWSYPAPVDDLADPSLAHYLKSFGVLSNLAPIYWPSGPVREDMDVLVAGCGTMAGACYAHLNRRCRVVGIDISRASLAHEQRLKEHHNLTNLTLHQCPIEEAGKLGATFDFIACHGVLHHLPDPVAGLRALGEVLRPDGVIALMVYGKYGRAQVYPFQELFRIVGLEQEPQDVAVVKQTLAALPAGHPLQFYLRVATDLKDDAGIVDTFLHRRDIAYSVTDCLNLVKDAGLAFQGWDNNILYHPEGLFAGAPLLRERIERLPEREMWQAMELASGALGIHHFHACRSDRDPSRYRAPWDSQALLDCVPLFAGRLAKGAWPDGRPAWAMVREGLPPIVLSEAQAATVSRIDGRRTARECILGGGVSGGNAVLHTFARSVFGLLWRTGFGVMRLTPRA
ncbi:MAG: SAM-dependent methyltransferase [Phycisphaerales bacterium]|jgi:2-polyprenyl-3-methyl-5-hydroxy-6-metoxy-1,4-benzoquinol methylase|nr:SAM-dependent methyltransferase [Phycisphaerales bacterium]